MPGSPMMSPWRTPSPGAFSCQPQISSPPLPGHQSSCDPARPPADSQIRGAFLGCPASTGGRWADAKARSVQHQDLAPVVGRGTPPGRQCGGAAGPDAVALPQFQARPSLAHRPLGQLLEVDHGPPPRESRLDDRFHLEFLGAAIGMRHHRRPPRFKQGNRQRWQVAVGSLPRMKPKRGIVTQRHGEFDIDIGHDVLKFCLARPPNPPGNPRPAASLPV
jgi:hypothetical protein